MFNRFAAHAARIVSGAGFFCFCLLLVVIWLPSYFLFGSIDTWQLIINTITTIVTFLLVALLQNSQEVFEDATNKKLDAIADALADFMEVNPNLDSRHAKELRAAVGCEKEVE